MPTTDADRFIDKMNAAKPKVEDPATRLIFEEAMEMIAKQESHIGTLRELKDGYSSDIYALRNENTHLKATRTSPWRTMETAPKNKVVDIWDGSVRIPDCQFVVPYGCEGQKARWCSLEVVDNDGIEGFDPIDTPTLWMLPAEAP